MRTERAWCVQGLTLTAASLVVFAELDWTPGTLEQCEDRAHRIGQRDTVHVHYLVAAGSLDDWVWSALSKKVVGLVACNIQYLILYSCDLCLVQVSQALHFCTLLSDRRGVLTRNVIVILGFKTKFAESGFSCDSCCNVSYVVCISM